MRAAFFVFAPGFWDNEAVHVALAVGTAVAIVAAVVGVFTVMRGQSFAGESLGDIGTAGGSAASYIGTGPLGGFVVTDVAAVFLMELIGVQRVRGRDLATGVVLGASIGVAALFLYLDTTQGSDSNATVTIIFGSIFAISPSTIPAVIALGVLAVGLIALLYRPLLLATVSPEIAAARGIPVRAVGVLYLVALALAAALAAITIGTILSTALLIGPAAAALRLTTRPLRAMLVATALGIGAVWVGILLAYDSYHWPPREHGWPVSFFVVALVFVFYLLSGLPGLRDRRRARLLDRAEPGAAEA
ncbi:MAG TPA: metal ABC transporter permease [Solirubrobacterales bacterium]|nr:metal ABC transporter permease [Solirubrobacterales bacterium]